MPNFLTNFLLFRDARMRMAQKKFRAALTSELAEEFLQLILQLMSLLFFLNRDFRRNIEGFNGRYLFKSRDGSITVAAIFGNGQLQVRERQIEGPNVTVTFKDQKALKAFLLSPKPDILGSMLRQEVKVDGNLAYLYKFGYMANHVKLMFSGEA